MNLAAVLENAKDELRIPKRRPLQENIQPEVRESNVQPEWPTISSHTPEEAVNANYLPTLCYTPTFSGDLLQPIANGPFFFTSLG